MTVQSKRVLVTGADGFIGSHLVEYLVQAGAQVTALSHYNSFNDWGWLENIECLDEVQVLSGDIRDAHFCLSITKRIELVFHLAALIAIPYSYRAPDSYVDTNIKGTLNVCQAALTNNVARVILMSTSEVYGTARYVPIDENHPLNPQSPYSASKIAADAIALSFYNSFQLPVIVARPFNTYGPRQSARAVIPTIITQLISGKQKIELGDLTTTRDFTFVEDTCQGLLAIAGLDGAEGEVFHVGSNHEISIGDLFSLIAELTNSDAQVVSEQTRMRPPKSEVLRLRCNNKKLLDRAHFQPRIPLREGLEKTIRWYQIQTNLSRYKDEIYNV